MGTRRAPARGMAQRTAPPDMIGATPDDGGNRGIFGRPEDELVVRDPTSDDMSDGFGPPTSQDGTYTHSIDRIAPRRGIGIIVGTLLIAVLVAAVVVLTEVVALLVT